MLRFSKKQKTTRPHPTHLQQSDSSLLDLETGKQYELTQALKGRGQIGLANFYSTDGPHQLLIKEDNPATCLLEGTAYFVKEAKLLPKALENAVNFATAGHITRPHQPSLTVSIQDRVMPDRLNGSVLPWDELVYGRKRNPHTLFSFESWYPASIQESISHLNSDAQWQLAAGIFSSMVAGDESLHVGQFMALLDDEGNITGIKRIDLGARERYAQSRDTKGNLDVFHASPQYQSTGQFNKDYVSFLFSEPQLKKKYTLLWARLTHQDEKTLSDAISQTSYQAILKQFQAIPSEHKAKTISDILKTLNKGEVLENQIKIPETTKKIDAQIDFLAKTIATLDINRFISMKKQAHKHYTKEMALMEKRISDLPPQNQPLQNTLKTALQLQQNNLSEKEDLNKTLETSTKILNDCEKHLQSHFEIYQNNPKDPTPLTTIILISEIAADLLEQQKLSLWYAHKQDHRDHMEDLDEQLTLYNTWYDTANYCAKSTSEDKKDYVRDIMNKTLKGNEELIDYLKENTRTIQVLAEHKSWLGYLAASAIGTKSRGHQLLRKLFHQHNIPDTWLAFSDFQSTLLAEIIEGHYQKTTQMIANQNFTVSDALVPDRFGRTALHYLMENGHNQHAIDAIVGILKCSIGNVKNTDLNVPDGNGETPCHLLKRNPFAEEIEYGINQANIQGYRWGKRYQLQHFFDMSRTNNANLTPEQAALPTKRKPPTR